MDTYDDYCWFLEPSLSNSSAAKDFEISGNNAQRYDQHRQQQQQQQQQQPSAGLYSNQDSFHHHQHHTLPRSHHGGRQSHHHQSPQIVVNSALNSPSSGYCSSEDCPGGFAPTFGGAVGFSSPRGVGDKQLNDSAKPFVDRRLFQSLTSSSLTSSSSSLVGSGSPSPWQVVSPAGVLTSSDPCLGQQAAHMIQQQQQNKLQHSNFTVSQTMHQDFVDDYGAAWSGAIGFDDIEALWDPFGATGGDRMAPIRHQRLTDAAPFETVASPSSATSCRGAVGTERMDSSSFVKDQNFFGQCHHHGLASTPNTSIGSGYEHSYVGIAASAIASQSGVGDRFVATGSGFDDGTPVDYGYCMSNGGMATGVLGETSLIDILQRDAYLSSTSLSVGCGSGFGLGSSSVSGDLGAAAASSGTVGQFQQIGTDNSSFFSHPSPNGARPGVRPSSVLLHDSDVMVGGGSMAGYHLQHMAADMATGCDDTDDFDMFHRFVDDSADKGRTFTQGCGIMSSISTTLSGSCSSAVDSSKASWDGQCETLGARGKPGSALFSGVFGQRRTVTPDPSNMAFSTAKAVGPTARSRGLAVTKSCGSLLQIAPSYGLTGEEPTRGNDSLRLQPTGSSQPRGANSAARSSAAGCARVDVRGGRSLIATNASCVTGTSSSSLYPGLDDHRYTTKAMPTVQVYPPTKVQKTQRNGSKQPAGTSRLNHAVSSSTAGSTGVNNNNNNNATSVLGSRSILEAFLRSTRPMDPNKGSNAALAAEGLLHLHIGDRSPRKHRSLRSTSSSDADEDDDQQSGTLLKKLLTGELDQSDFQRGRDRPSTTRRCGGNVKRNYCAADKSSSRKHRTPRAPPPSREEVIDDSSASSSMPIDVDFSTVEQNDGLDPVTAMVNSRFSIGNSNDDLVGLGIDMDLSLLDDPTCMAIFGMIEDADVDDYDWMSSTAAAAASGDCCDLDDKISPTTLDEILYEDLRDGIIVNRWHEQLYADETHAGPGVGDAIGAV